MIELQGQYNTAKIFTDNAEQAALAQIQHLLDQWFMAGSKIRVMSDCHAGMGCTVGMTMTILDKVVPGFVGTDIGCGMTCALINGKRIDLNQLDKTIHQHIPAGFSVRAEPHHFMEEIDLSQLRCAKHVDIDRAARSMGTLGGGNHFIEVGKDEYGQLYLVVHSGSRNLGKQVCDHYQFAAASALGRRGAVSDRMFAYVEGELLEDYLFDMKIVQEYADLNRRAIVKEISKRLKLRVNEQFSTVHNYIDFTTVTYPNGLTVPLTILRKGAVSAKEGERLLVPMNMRDGSLLCVGKGNPDWNYSAPHGAGRAMSRADAKANITLNDYKKSMEGIFSTTVNKSTLDESPAAYKPAQEIIDNTSDTMTVTKVIKPVYNFKAGQD